LDAGCSIVVDIIATSRTYMPATPQSSWCPARATVIERTDWGTIVHAIHEHTGEAR
jgi:hypothetical protein